MMIKALLTFSASVSLICFAVTESDLYERYPDLRITHPAPTAVPPNPRHNPPLTHRQTGYPQIVAPLPEPEEFYVDLDDQLENSHEEQSLTHLVPSAPSHADPHHIQEFPPIVYPQVEPFPEHLQPAQQEPDIFDELVGSVAGFIEWFKDQVK